MFKAVDEKFIKMCTKDGSLLKKIRSIGGGGAALAAIGGMFIFINLIAIFAMVATQNHTGEKFLDAGMLMRLLSPIIIWLILIFLGMSMTNKRANKYISYFLKKSNYTEAQLQEFDKEVLEPSSSYYVINSKKLVRNSVLFSIVVTRNWLKAVGIPPIRLEDIAAMFFEERITYKNQRWDDSLFILLSSGELTRYTYVHAQSKAAIEQVVNRNPYTINARHIQVGDQTYDCVNQPEEVAELYRNMISSKQQGAAQ